VPTRDHDGVLPVDDVTAGQRRRIAVQATLHTIATLALVVTIYFLIPMDHAADAGTVAALVLGLLAFVAGVAWQLHQIVRSGYPSVRVVEALAFSVPLYIFVCDGELSHGACECSIVWCSHDPD
jgi:hypothetical protein